MNLRPLFCAALLLSGSAAQAATRFVELHGSRLPTEGIINAGIVADRDVTGDGVADVVSCTAGSPVVYGRKDGEYAPVWLGAPVGCTAVTVGDLDADGNAEIVAGTRAGIHIFDPRTSTTSLRHVTLTNIVRAVRVGNVDADAATEIVAVTEKGTLVYTAATLALEWDATYYGGKDLHIANVDDDTRAEIVVNGSTGWVLDAQARVLEWGYAAGFGLQMTTANVDADSESEMVFITTDGNATILHGDDFQTTSFAVAGGPTGLAVASVTGDSAPEIVIGTFGAFIRAYSVAGTLVSTIATPRANIIRIAFGDVDGDGATEICFTAGTSAAATLLAISDLSGNVENSIGDLDGPFSTAAADLDRDGQPELIVAASSTWERTGAGVVRVLDGRTRKLKATITVPEPARYAAVLRVEVGQLDSDPALEILLLSGLRRLYVFDGVTYVHQWTGLASDSGPGYGDALAVANIDDDPVDEIIVEDGYGFVAVLNGASDIRQWMSQTQLWLRDLAIADLDGNGKKEIVGISGASLYILTPATNETRVVRLPEAATSVAAMTGRITVTSSPYSIATVRSFRPDGVQEWSCQWTGPGYSYTSNAAFQLHEGRLIVTAENDLLLVPLSGDCAASELFVYDSTIRNLAVADVTGDGRAELLLGLDNSWAILAIGSSTESRGDVNRDGVVTGADLDALTRYLLADGPGITPAADVNGDGAITTKDLVYLIDVQRGTSPAPPP